jgi:excisionase family DNA binding protein
MIDTDAAPVSLVPGWTTVDEAAEVRAGLVGRDAIYRLVNEGRIRVARVSRRRLLIPVGWLEELAENENRTRERPAS